jgi:hypothetical protein
MAVLANDVHLWKPTDSSCWRSQISKRVVGFETHKQVSHPGIPRDEITYQASPLLGRGGEITQEIAS